MLYIIVEYRKVMNTLMTLLTLVHVQQYLTCMSTWVQDSETTVRMVPHKCRKQIGSVEAMLCCVKGDGKVLGHSIVVNIFKYICDFILRLIYTQKQ